MEPDDVLYKEKFTWNRHKNDLNVKKHHISFEVASLVFDDPFLYETWDAENSSSEDRFIVTGSVTGIVNAMLVTVSVTYRGADLIRIISARAADPAERKEYYEKIIACFGQGGQGD
jgi:uncharacterized DUF497 family protein